MVYHQHCSLWRWADRHGHYQLRAHCAIQNITTAMQ